MILPPVRDPRLITVRRGGTLIDDDHHLLGLWAADCAEHVLALFEARVPGDTRPREAIAAIRAWARSDVGMMVSRAAGGHAMGAARPLRGAPRWAAYSAGQAAVVAHVAEHDLGAAAYAIKAVMAAAGSDGAEDARLAENDWQHERLPSRVKAFVLEDQRRRNPLCWSVFEVGS